MQTLEIRPVCEALGAVISGVDLSGPIDDSLADALRDALDRYHLLLFRDQEIDEQQQLSIARLFGPLSRQGVAEQKGFGDVGFISNVHPQKRGGTHELVFHSDQAAYQHPERVLLLYGLQIPSWGGETLFSSLTRAYRDLPAALKERIAGLNGLHVFDYNGYFTKQQSPTRIRAKDLPADARRAFHPLVWPHPRTNTPILYINERHLSEVDGLPEDESEALLEELKTYIRRPDNIYTHEWKLRDLVVWDNLAVLHARKVWDTAEPRTLRRAQTGWPEVVRS